LGWTGVGWNKAAGSVVCLSGKAAGLFSLSDERVRAMNGNGTDAQHRDIDRDAGGQEQGHRMKDRHDCAGDVDIGTWGHGNQDGDM
jgi:hypothetical protein